MQEDKRIEVKKLTWQPERVGEPILNDISVTLQAGHFYGILGANGSGKTSLLKHILSLQPSERAVFLDGKEIEKWSRNALAEKMSYVPQNTACEADFTVEEMVMQGRFPYQGRWGNATPKDRQIVKEAIAITGSEALEKKSVRCLSGGEMQRVAAARAIAQQTEWMFLDEPVSQLDIRHQLELMDILKCLCEQKGITVVAVLHDINLALRYCDRVLLMKEGRLRYAGKMQETITTQRLKDIYGILFEELYSRDGVRYMVPAGSIG